MKIEFPRSGMRTPPHPPKKKSKKELRVVISVQNSKYNKSKTTHILINELSYGNTWEWFFLRNQSFQNLLFPEKKTVANDLLNFAYP